VLAIRDITLCGNITGKHRYQCQNGSQQNHAGRHAAYQLKRAGAKWSPAIDHNIRELAYCRIRSHTAEEDHQRHQGIRDAHMGKDPNKDFARQAVDHADKPALRIAIARP
jgi:hypothetical protein